MLNLRWHFLCSSASNNTQCGLQSVMKEHLKNMWREYEQHFTLERTAHMSVLDIVWMNLSAFSNPIKLEIKIKSIIKYQQIKTMLTINSSKTEQKIKENQEVLKYIIDSLCPLKLNIPWHLIDWWQWWENYWICVSSLVQIIHNRSAPSNLFHEFMLH